MHKQKYVDKVNSLLDDKSTYEISNLIIIKNDKTFNKRFEKLVKNKKELNFPHWTPPYDPHIIRPT